MKETNVPCRDCIVNCGERVCVLTVREQMCCEYAENELQRQ